MFDIAPSELLLVAIVALVVIGPKDLPRAMRVVGQWIARARGVARHFRSNIDDMMRQSELADMEKKWADENARIMREHPATEPTPPMIEGEMIPLGGPPEMIEPVPTPEPSTPSATDDTNPADDTSPNVPKP